jgi:hypothetical protein
MPQRASQRKFGRSLELQAKQKRQKLEETSLMFVEEKSIRVRGKGYTAISASEGS